MLKKLNWQAYTGGQRNNVIEDVKESILKNDGCIVNFNMFSDLEISLSIEIEEKRITDLYTSFSNILNISDCDIKKLKSNSKKEWLIFMSISFSVGKGKLSIEKPSIPG